MISPGGRPIDETPLSASKTDNWVARVGGLPGYIRGVARGIAKSHGGKVTSRDIKIAISRMKVWAAGGDGVRPAVRAAAAAALAEWEGKRAASHALAFAGSLAVDLSTTPIVSAQDGPRMAGIANFGGKKAAPFGSKKVAAKRAAKVAMAKKAASAGHTRSMSYPSGRTIDLGKDGARWRHDYIPENAAAVALKAHRSPGSSGSTKGSAKIKADAARSAASAAKATPHRGKPLRGDNKDHYLAAADRRTASEASLKRHIAIHQQAVLRAHKPDAILLHKKEIAATKREIARRHTPPVDPEVKAARAVARLNSTDPLRSLTHAEILGKLKDTNTTEVERVALKAESARRLSEAHTLARQAQAGLDEAKKELGEGKFDDPETQSRVLKTLYKHAPFLKGPLEKIRVSHVGKAISKGASLDQWVTQGLNGLLVPLIGAGVGGLLSALH